MIFFQQLLQSVYNIFSLSLNFFFSHQFLFFIFIYVIFLLRGFYYARMSHRSFCYSFEICSIIFMVWQNLKKPSYYLRLSFIIYVAAGGKWQVERFIGAHSWKVCKCRAAGELCLLWINRSTVPRRSHFPTCIQSPMSNARALHTTFFLRLYAMWVYEILCAHQLHISFKLEIKVFLQEITRQAYGNGEEEKKPEAAAAAEASAGDSLRPVNCNLRCFHSF